MYHSVMGRITVADDVIHTELHHECPLLGVMRTFSVTICSELLRRFHLAQTEVARRDIDG